MLIGKRSKNICASVIHIKAKSKSIKHKKQGRKGIECIYFDKDKQTCTSYLSGLYNHFCNSNKCYIFKSSKLLSQYDENHIELPVRASVHESDNRYIGIGKNIGTPCHVGFIKSDGIRRHKTHCVYYDKMKKFCTKCLYKCIGSSKCDNYQEK